MADSMGANRCRTLYQSQVRKGNTLRGYAQMFNEAKTAHMAAYLLSKAGGRMRYIKLLKLLYLADRESMRRTGDSMTRDAFFSLKNGPVLSKTLDLLNGRKDGKVWSELVRKVEYNSELATPVKPDELDELSPFNIEILDSIYGEFGHMSWQALIQWTHDNCPEWKDPGSTCVPIAPKDIFTALGRNARDAAALAAEYSSRRELERVWAKFG